MNKLLRASPVLRSLLLIEIIWVALVSVDSVHAVIHRLDLLLGFEPLRRHQVCNKRGAIAALLGWPSVWAAWELPLELLFLLQLISPLQPAWESIVAAAILAVPPAIDKATCDAFMRKNQVVAVVGYGSVLLILLGQILRQLLGSRMRCRLTWLDDGQVLLRRRSGLIDTIAALDQLDRVLDSCPVLLMLLQFDVLRNQGALVSVRLLVMRWWRTLLGHDTTALGFTWDHLGRWLAIVFGVRWEVMAWSWWLINSHWRIIWFLCWIVQGLFTLRIQFGCHWSFTIDASFNSRLLILGLVVDIVVSDGHGCRLWLW